MNYADIHYNDIANGIGVRTALFVSGCTHHCKGCFNEETWDFNYGKEFTKEVEDKIIESLRPSHIKGLTILGGEPWEVVNQAVLRPFMERIKKELPDKGIWMFSGYLFEQLTDPENKRCHSEDTMKMLEMTDVLIDGPFILAKKNISLRFRGSENQRVLDIPQSLKEGKPVLSKYMVRD